MSVGPLPTNPRHILVRSPNWLGDAVMCTPALERLHERFPQASISLVAQAKLADLWAQHPHLTRTLIIHQGQHPWQVAREIRQLDCDLAVVFPNSLRSALEVFLARIPMRVGYAGRFRKTLLNHTVARRPGHASMKKRSAAEVRDRLRSSAPRTRYPASGHHLFEYLHLVGALGANTQPVPPRLHVTPAEVQAVRERWLPKFQPEQGLLISFNPGAEYGPAKRWPADAFAALSRECARVFPRFSGVILGGPGDIALCQAVAAQAAPGLLNLCGQTSLRQMTALLKLCAAVVTNDTGPMHVASALGTPVVALFGSTSPELTGPGLPGSGDHQVLTGDVACAPCFLRECPIDLRCLKRTQVADVLAALQRVLA